MYRLNQETPQDWWEVEALFDLCFAPGREALSSYRLRDGVDPVQKLCLTARDGDDVLAAAIRYWPVRIGQNDALLLGPIAVHPTRQGEGLGGFLIGESLQLARAAQWSRVLLIGDASYYGRFGFVQLPGLELPPPTNPARILGLELIDNSWGHIAGAVDRWEPAGNPAKP